MRNVDLKLSFGISEECLRMYRSCEFRVDTKVRTYINYNFFQLSEFTVNGLYYSLRGIISNGK